MHSFAPDGWFLDFGAAQGCILYGGPKPGGCLVAGWEIVPIDFRVTTAEARHEAYAQCVALLAGLHLSVRQVQFSWSLSPSFAAELNYYKQETERLAARGPAKAIELRRSIAADYEQRMLSGVLRRERLRMYLTVDVPTPEPLTRGLEDRVRASIVAGRSSLFAAGESVRLLLGGCAAVRPMTGRDLFVATYETLNPGVLWRSLAWDEEDQIWAEKYRPEEPIQTLTHLTDYKAGGPGPHCFVGDGLYHGAYVLRQYPAPPPPEERETLLCLPLLSLPFNSYAVTLTIRPQDVDEQLQELTERLKLAKGSHRSGGNIKDSVDEERLTAEIRALAAGYSLPQQVRLTVHTWADTQEQMQTQGWAIKTAVDRSLRGATLYEVSLFREAIRVLWERVPGWPGAWKSYLHETIHLRAAALIPLSGTFIGARQPQMLLTGSQESVVGLRVDSGGSPLSGYVVGKTGSGKGMLCNSLILQTAPYMEAIVLVEDGPSYRGIVKEVFGEEPIVVAADTGLRINPFDPVGAPLDGERLSLIVSLLTLFTGARDLEARQKAGAILGYYLKEFLADAASQVKGGERLAVAIDRIRARMPKGTSLAEAWAIWRGLDPETQERLLSAVSQAAMTDLAATKRGRETIAAIGAALLAPEQVPQLANFVVHLKGSRHPDHDRHQVRHMADMIAAWTEEGGRYLLFDGATNISLRGRVTYFQLDKSVKTDDALREAAFLLVAGHVRQYLMSLPARSRKLVIFDEAASILSSQSGADLLSAYYRQGRKSGIATYSVYQDFQAMDASEEVRVAVTGSADQALILKLQNTNDRARLSAACGIPLVGLEAVARAPDPKEMPSGEQYSTLLIHLMTGAEPVSGIARHQVLPGLLRLADTSPAGLAKRQEAEQAELLEGLLT